MKYLGVIIKLYLSLAVLCNYSCVDPNENNENKKDLIPELVTTDITDITAFSAVSGGKITDKHDIPLLACGVCWDTIPAPTIESSKTLDNISKTIFVSSAGNLRSNTTYFLRSYALNKYGVGYGNERSFTTLKDAPLLKTNEVTSCTDSSAIGGGSVSNYEDYVVREFGVCADTLSLPTIDKRKFAGEGSLDLFTANLSGLDQSTSYYIRSYMLTDDGAFYGNEITFKTNRTVIMPSVTTNPCTEVTETGAIGNIRITNPDGCLISECGICLSGLPSPSVTDTKFVADGLLPEIIVSINDLSGSTTYYARGYIIVDKTILYGNEVIFTTNAGIILPEVLTTEVKSITDVSVLCGGTITNNGGSEIIECGLCWAESGFPTYDDSKLISTDKTSFTLLLSGLTPQTTYVIRAFAKNEKGIAYGNIVSFSTAKTIQLPQLTTLPVSNITSTGATGGGIIVENGGGEITECGICWSSGGVPTYDDSKLISSSGNTYSLTMSGLIPETTYKIRAFARNSKGIGYGNSVSFTTSRNITLPQLITLPASGITSTSAVCKGRISDNGGASVTECGICWSRTSNPTYENDHISAGKLDIGEFNVSVSGLATSTRYYACAYAKNSKGINYGNVVEFTTLSGAPDVQTYSPGSITVSSIRVNGYVADNGGGVTLRGICWGTVRNPDITGRKTIEGAGSGSFSSLIEGLNHATTYYFRAYATDKKGITYYGSEVSAKTKAMLPVINASMEKYTGIDALCNANVSVNGGSPVTSRGFCWSIVPNPTINDRRILCGSGNGMFAGTIGALLPNTKYYVRAFASNEAGTAYSNEMTFTTQKNPLFINLYKGSAPSGDVWLTLHFTYTGPLSVKSAGLIYGTDRSAVEQGKGMNANVTIGKEAIIKIGLNKYYYIMGYAVLSDNTTLYSGVVREYLQWH